MNAFDSSPPTLGCYAAILPAAGSGQRFGAESNKLFALLDDKPLWYHAASRLRDQGLIGRIVMAIASVDRDRFQSEYADMVSELQIELVAGGAARTDSVRAGLEHLADDDSVRFIVVHDAAWPLVSAADLASVLAIASQSGAALLATPMPGTVKREVSAEASSGSQQFHGSGGSETVDRRNLWIALTPQVFHVDVLREAYEKYRGRPATDDAELVERIGRRVALVRGSAENIKITHPEDLLIAQAILKRQNKNA